MIMLSPLVQAPRPWWPRKVSSFPSCPSASTAPEHEELCSSCVFIALPQVCMQTRGRAGVLHASFVIFLLFVVILSSSQAVVVAGLQRAEPQNDGLHLTLCILEVLGRAQNVNLLLNLVISVCKKKQLVCCLPHSKNSLIPVFLLPYNWVQSQNRGSWWVNTAG